MYYIYFFSTKCIECCLTTWNPRNPATPLNERAIFWIARTWIFPLSRKLLLFLYWINSSVLVILHNGTYCNLSSFVLLSAALRRLKALCLINVTPPGSCPTQINLSANHSSSSGTLFCSNNHCCPWMPVSNSNVTVTVTAAFFLVPALVQPV